MKYGRIFVRAEAMAGCNTIGFGEMGIATPPLTINAPLTGYPSKHVPVQVPGQRRAA